MSKDDRNHTAFSRHEALAAESADDAMQEASWERRRATAVQANEMHNPLTNAMAAIDMYNIMSELADINSGRLKNYRGILQMPVVRCPDTTALSLLLPSCTKTVHSGVIPCVDSANVGIGDFTNKLADGRLVKLCHGLSRGVLVDPAYPVDAVVPIQMAGVFHLDTHSDDFAFAAPTCSCNSSKAGALYELKFLDGTSAFGFGHSGRHEHHDQGARTYLFAMCIPGLNQRAGFRLIGPADCNLSSCSREATTAGPCHTTNGLAGMYTLRYNPTGGAVNVLNVRGEPALAGLHEVVYSPTFWSDWYPEVDDDDLPGPYGHVTVANSFALEVLARHELADVRMPEGRGRSSAECQCGSDPHSRYCPSYRCTQEGCFEPVFFYCPCDALPLCHDHTSSHIEANHIGGAE